MLRLTPPVRQKHMHNQLRNSMKRFMGYDEEFAYYGTAFFQNTFIIRVDIRHDSPLVK